MPNKRADYEAYREGQAAISRKRSEEGREIGPLPPVENPRRKARCRSSHELFAKTYFPKRFKLKSAECHVRAGEAMQTAVDEGGTVAIAMPRGSGKTAKAEVELLRAILYGIRRFGVLVQATEKLSGRALQRVQRELESNDRLLADFPEVCYPIRRLKRIHNRAKGQTLNGVPTRIEFTKEGVILPTVAGSPASGSAILITSIEAAARGLSVAGPDGEMIRPDLLLIDDAQTRGSARSPIETDFRESIITDDLMGMVGPGESMAAVMLCTPIYVNDLAERFLSADRHGEWQSLRTRMVEAWPERMDLWDRYAEIRRVSLRDGRGGREATAFYKANRAAMDAGARVSWPERVKKGDLSGLQTAMNLFYANPRGFRAEYNCEPDEVRAEAGRKEIPVGVAARLSGLVRGVVPREATRLTAFVDVGGEVLWYGVAAWDADFGGAVVDYGTWPRQARALFAATDPRPGLSARHPGLSESERVYAGLTELVAEVCGREYVRDGTGERLRVERLLVDVGWNSATVYKFCRQNAHAGVIYPSKGIGRTATARGVSEWKPRPGERTGYHWRLTMSETGLGRMVQFDPDAWKTFLHERLTQPMGGRGCLVLPAFDAAAPGQPQRKADHEMLGQHLAAETAEPVTIRGATFDKWVVKPHRPDNHLLDVLVGLAVAASVQGAVWSAGGPPAPKPVPAKRETWAEIQARKRAEGAYTLRHS